MARRMGQTGTPDPIYDLISVAYHALEGAQTYELYVQDAQQQGDQELADYFRRTQQQFKQAGDEARQLLASRLPQGGAGAGAGEGAGVSGAAMGHAGGKPGSSGS